MAWGVRWYSVGGLGVLSVLGVLAGCTGGGLFAEREQWRHDAEVQCLSSGAVRESAGVVRIKEIRGPGMCGADFPLKVSMLGETAPLGYSDDLRPPGAIPRGAAPQRWPIRTDNAPPDASAMPPPADTDQPISLNPPGAANGSSNAPDTYDFRRPYATPPSAPPSISRVQSAPPVVPLGPDRAPQAAITPVAVKPAATLACPIVSELDHWIVNTVQPAALHWFGAPVAEIKQISAYSCRGMNGNPNAKISEHAFGNALDIAAFTLVDGRTISVKNGWRGLPEEQGFLRDVQGAACDQFTTVLAPGSNAFHYDHIHVDLMRRSNGHRICNPHAVSGEEVAARAGGRYAARRVSEPSVTGALNYHRLPSPPKRLRVDPDDEKLRRDWGLPRAEPGNDGTED